MDPVTILLAIATLLKNPKLGGGGVGAEKGHDLLIQLVAFIRGGRATAQALEAWGEEIKAMADAGVNPTQRDFDRWTSRLDTALNVIEEAKQQLQEEQGLGPKAAENEVVKAAGALDEPAPVETPALAALDSAVVNAADPVVNADDDQQALDLTEENVEKVAEAVQRTVKGKKGK